jgi:putative transposase
MQRRLNAPPSAGFRHVMSRAAPGAALCEDRADARGLLARLGEVCAELPLDVHAYCVLPRHVHLLVRAEAEVAAAALSRLGGGESPRVVPVALGRHLMEVSRYLHLNPVDAGLSWRPEDWPFSSLRAYLGDPAAPRWLTTAAVLGRFGTIGARHRYRAYVYAGMDPGTRDAHGRPRWSALFAAGSVLEDLAWRIEPVLGLGPSRRVPIEPSARAPLAPLAREIAARFGVPVDVLRAVRLGGARAALARGALVHAARGPAGLRLADVAAWLGYASPSAAAAAAERFDRLLRADPVLAARFRSGAGLKLAEFKAANASSSGT